MSKNRKHALRQASKLKVEFNYEEFSIWLTEKVFVNQEKLAKGILETMSTDKKSRNFFKPYKEELIKYSSGEDTFSKEFALEVYKYMEKYPQGIRITLGGSIPMSSTDLKNRFLAIKKYEANQEAPKDDIEDINPDLLLEKIEDQGSLIASLKDDKSQANEEIQQLKSTVRKFESYEEENQKLQDENDDLRNEVDALRSEIEDLKCRLRDASIATPQATNSSNATINKLKEENLSLKEEIKNKESIIDGFISLVSSMQDLIKPAENKSIKKNDKKAEKPDRPGRNVSKTVINNSNRFTPDKPKPFALRSHQVFQSFKTQEIRLRGWRTPRQTPYKATKPKNSTKNKTETLTKSLSLDELFEMKSLKVCLIREKKPEEMTEIIKLFADDSRHIQPYRESFDVKDFYVETKKDDFDIFAIFKDSTKHEFSEGVWWRGIENAVIFEFGEEKEGENRSRVSAQIKIIQKILEKSRELKGVQIA